jgi:hypothetical protein
VFVFGSFVMQAVENDALPLGMYHRNIF